MKKRGKLFVISAPSGTGKTTVVRKLLSENPWLIESISYTTRKPRIGEKDGSDYHFVDLKKFKKLVDEDFFAEYAEVHGEYYGTPLRPIIEIISDGKNVVLDVDVQGGMSLKSKFPEAITIFLLPPSEEELNKRLRGRGTESESQIEKRLENAHLEMRFKDQYDFCVVNDDLDRTVRELAQFIKNPQ